MAPPNLENGQQHTSSNRSTVAGSSMDSLGSFVHFEEVIKESIAEDLEPHKNELEANGVNLNTLLNQEAPDLIKIHENIKRFKDAELNDASTLADLIAGKIAGFDREQLLEMLDFSKISYGDRDRKLKKDGYKTKRQLAEEGYRIIQFFEDERTENQYCPDEDYKLEQRNYGYDLICSNSWNRDAGYVFIKDREVTIAYHGTRDGSDFKTDLYAYLTKLPFSPEGDSVHSGFYSLFKRSWPSVHKILKGYANDQGVKIKDLKINVTGHSMGGPLASIAALCLNKTENAENVHVATFGSPRVFYKDAAKVYNDGCLGNKTIRVACRSDNIPCLPPGGGHEYYKHVGQALKLGVNETTFIPDVTLHYHRLNTYRSLIKDIKQENFKSDNVSSWWRYLAYPFGKLSSNIPVKISEDSDKEFFKKVEEENEDIKLSEISKECSPSLEEELKQKEQEVSHLKEKLSSIQQSLDEKTEELKNTQAQLEQERSGVQQELAAKIEELESTNKKVLQLEQELGNAKQGLDKIIGEFKGKFENSKKELDNQTQNLNAKTKELERKEVQLGKNKIELNYANQKVLQLQEKLDGIEAQLEQERKGASEKLTQEQQKISQLNDQVEKLAAEFKGTKNQLAEKKAELDEQTRRVTELNDIIQKLKETNTALEGKIDDLNNHLTVKIEELKKAKTELEEKVEFTGKELEDARAQLKESERGLREVKAQLEQENSNLSSQARELEGKYEQTEVQLVESEKKLAEEVSKVTQLRKESNEARAQLEEKEKGIRELNDKNEKFLEARIYSKRQGNYASVSFVLSGAFAVGASLTMLHLAICVSLIIAASNFLAVGCYCSYKANTALSDVGQIGNDPSHSVV